MSQKRGEMAEDVLQFCVCAGPVCIGCEDAATKLFKQGWDAAVANDERVLALIEALVWADEMFTARDEMNAKVHCAPLRLSPITERVKQALALYSEGEKK